MKDDQLKTVVIVLEDKAHLPSGHFGIRFAELAEGFVAQGCETHLLTSLGWAHEASFSFPVDKIHTFGRFAKFLHRFSLKGGGRLGVLRGIVRNLSLAYQTRRLARKLGAKKALCVCLAFGDRIDPSILSLMGGQHDWIVHKFDNVPNRIPKVVRWVSNTVRQWRNVKCLVSVSDESLLAVWRENRPEQTSGVVRLAGATVHGKIDGARAKLNLSDTDFIALIFGAAHKDKLPHVAIEAFKQRPNLKLYFVGTGANMVLRKYAHMLSPNIFCLPGSVSNQERHLWHQAADVAILSFGPNYIRNSGTLMDAISAGCPVVVSDHSLAAELTRKYQIGNIFQPGDIDGLIDAIDKVRPLNMVSKTLALEDLSNKQVAKEHLQAIGR